MEAVIFTGIQASGKSEFYKQHFYDSHIRINLDMLKTRNREAAILKACIATMQPFVIDNTNPSAADRKKYIELAKDAGFQVIGYYFQSNIADAIARNEQRSGRACIPRAGLLGTYNKLQLPSWEEDFDQLYYVRIGKDYKFVVEEFKDEV